MLSNINFVYAENGKNSESESQSETESGGEVKLLPDIKIEGTSDDQNEESTQKTETKEGSEDKEKDEDKGKEGDQGKEGKEGESTDSGSGHKATDWSEIFDLGDKWISEGKIEATKKDQNIFTINEKDIKINATNVFNILLAIGTVLTVIIGGILGIKFIFGGIEDKAKIKEALIPFIVGCVAIFGAIAIWKYIVTILDMF